MWNCTAKMSKSNKIEKWWRNGIDSVARVLQSPTHFRLHKETMVLVICELDSVVLCSERAFSWFIMMSNCWYCVGRPSNVYVSNIQHPYPLKFPQTKYLLAFLSGGGARECSNYNTRMHSNITPNRMKQFQCRMN